MPFDIARLTAMLSREVGLAFVGEVLSESDDEKELSFGPVGYERQHTFSILARVKFRRIEIEFQPGPFAGDLLEAMSFSARDAQLLFWTVLGDCVNKGATVSVRVDDHVVPHGSEEVWGKRWRRFLVVLNRGYVDVGAGQKSQEFDNLAIWLLRFCAAVTAVLPVEAAVDRVPTLELLPEGAVQKVEVNRYERDRRNRAAAIAIHGLSCSACGMSFERVYGDVGVGYIEVHHITPVSDMGANYLVNPATDLVPLCSNCHSMVHRQSPPITVEHLRALISQFGR
jgi:5-methylcytosine-specific restriction protein A